MTMFLIYYKTMIMVNIYEAKAHLSQYLRKVQEGEKVLVCKRNVPVAEIVPIRQRPSGNRPKGLARGAFTVPADFNEPLPEQIVSAFYGASSEGGE